MAEEPKARFILEVETEGQMADLNNFVWYASRATKTLTDQGSWIPKVMAWWVEDENGVMQRHHMGCGPYGETQVETTFRRLEFPKPISREPRWIVDYAEIPDHPPIAMPLAEIPLPAHAMHDMRECDWCINHPLADNELRKLVGVD